MNAKTAAIPAEVLAVLHTATITGAIMKMQPGLDRALYVKVDKVLRDLGGKWDRRAGGHVFPSDEAAQAVAAASIAGAYVSPKANSLFVTPPEIVERVVARAMLAPGHIVLEPSAGTGALAVAAASIVGAEKVFVVEIQPDLFRGLTRSGLSAYVPEASDFLAEEPAAIFDRVVMNPPFNGREWEQHLRHAKKFLRPGGILVAVLPWNGDESIVFPGAHWEPNPAASFASEGTKVGTLLYWWHS